MKREDIQKLADWELSLKGELDSLQAKRKELDVDIQRLSKRLDLVRQMRALDEPRAGSDPDQEATPPGSELRTTPLAVREAAKAVLLAAARPLHINDIHRRFISSGHPIPGKGTPFNILVHLLNDKEFVRVSRGTYALAGTVPEDQVLPKAPRKRRTRKRRAARASGRV